MRGRVAGSFSLFDLPEGFGLGEAVDERRKRVHDEDRERDALGVGAGGRGADEHREESAAAAEHELALGGDGRGHVVRRHEACAEYAAAGEDVHERRHAALEHREEEHRADERDGDVPAAAGEDVHERRHAALEHREEEHRADERDGDVPGDDLAREQVAGADQEREGGDFADAAVHVADEEVLDERGLRPVEALGAFLDERERRGGGCGLDITGAQRPGGRAPRGHRPREGDEHERARAEGGVEGVVAESAEHLLRDADREHAAHGGHPDRQVGRQVEREEEAGENGGEVADRVVALHRKAAEPLRHEAGGDARAGEDERAHAEEVHAAAERGQKGDDHVQHEPARGRRSVCVRRRAQDVSLRCFFWFHELPLTVSRFRILFFLFLLFLRVGASGLLESALAARAAPCAPLRPVRVLSFPSEVFPQLHVFPLPVALLVLRVLFPVHSGDDCQD